MANLIDSAAGNDSLEGLAGSDTIYAGAGNDFVAGGDGTDLLYGGAGEDRVNGNLGRDTIYGDGGNDVLIGGNNDDFIFGGSGRDTLTGGQGADVFGFTAETGFDRVTDFDPNLDTVQISEAMYGKLRITSSSHGTTLTVGSDSMLLLGIQARDIGAIDFLFG